VHVVLEWFTYAVFGITGEYTQLIYEIDADVLRLPKEYVQSPNLSNRPKSSTREKHHPIATESFLSFTTLAVTPWRYPILARLLVSELPSSPSFFETESRSF
jgi:hypothetical protein